MNSNFPLNTEEIKQIVAWAREAGQIAMRYFRNVTIQRKADNSLLTQADLEIERFLAERLQANFPDYGLVGEEGARGNNDPAIDCRWTIDPIDGTPVFAQGMPGWGTAIGLLRQGQPAFGLFYMPLLDDMTYTAGPDEVISLGQPLQPALRRDWSMKGFLATAGFVHRDFKLDVPRVRAMGSVNANLIYTARGSATATFSPKPHVWDLVAGGAILLKMGGELRHLSGKSIDYLSLLDGRKVPEPVISGHPDVLDGLQKAIRPRPKQARG